MSDLENARRRALNEAREATQTYSDYWRGCLGSYLRGQPEERTHQSIARWLSDCTSNLICDVDDARKIMAAFEKWKADAQVARTIGVPEPSFTAYIDALKSTAEGQAEP